MAIKGSVALRHTNERCCGSHTEAQIWDLQYASRPLWWKGPYDIGPIIRGINSGAAVLDVGCGTGRYSVPLDRAGFTVVGLDLSQTALRSLPPHFDRIAADMQKLPLVDQSFDALTCYGALQHLGKEARSNAVLELFRVLKEGGKAFIEVIGVKDMRYGSGTQGEESTFVRQGIRCHYFSALELSQLFVNSGFVVLDLEDRLVKKCYRGVERTRHQVFLTAQRF